LALAQRFEFEHAALAVAIRATFGLGALEDCEDNFMGRVFVLGCFVNPGVSDSLEQRSFVVECKISAYSFCFSVGYMFLN
jgi:hypothetical protein